MDEIMSLPPERREEARKLAEEMAANAAGHGQGLTYQDGQRLAKLAMSQLEPKWRAQDEQAKEKAIQDGIERRWQQEQLTPRGDTSHYRPPQQGTPYSVNQGLAPDYPQGNPPFEGGQVPRQTEEAVERKPPKRLPIPRLPRPSAPSMPSGSLAKLLVGLRMVLVTLAGFIALPQIQAFAGLHLSWAIGPGKMLDLTAASWLLLLIAVAMNDLSSFNLFKAGGEWGRLVAILGDLGALAVIYAGAQSEIKAHYLKFLGPNEVPVVIALAIGLGIWSLRSSYASWTGAAINWLQASFVLLSFGTFQEVLKHVPGFAGEPAGQLAQHGAWAVAIFAILALADTQALFGRGSFLSRVAGGAVLALYAGVTVSSVQSGTFSWVPHFMGWPMDVIVPGLLFTAAAVATAWETFGEE